MLQYSSAKRSKISCSIACKMRVSSVSLGGVGTGEDDREGGCCESSPVEPLRAVGPEVLSGTPKKTRATGRGTRDRMRLAHSRLMTAISGAEGPWFRAKDGVGAEGRGAGVVLSALSGVVVSPVGPCCVGVGGRTDNCGGCGAGADNRFTSVPWLGRAFDGNSAALDARSKLGNKVGVRIWSWMVS